MIKNKILKKIDLLFYGFNYLSIILSVNLMCKNITYRFINGKSARIIRKIILYILP